MTQMAQSARELPAYRSHKTVWALKIKSVTPHGRTKEHDTVGALIVPEDAGYAPFEVSFAYLHKHQPKVGGYWVRYADGYESFSPAEAFEGGYTRI